MHLDEGFSDLENISVFDCDSLEIGRIIDFYFDKEYRLTHFVLITSQKTRLVFSIESISNKETTIIHLNISGSQLVQEAKMNEILENLLRFNEIKTYRVKSLDSRDLGKIIDVIFHIDNHLSFILGGLKINEFLKKFNLSTDNSIVLPHRYIREIEHDTLQINEMAEVFKQSIKVVDDEQIAMGDVRRMISNQAQIQYRINR